MTQDLKKMYSSIVQDHFPKKMEITFTGEGGKRQTLIYERVFWNIEGVEKGLRYGENPGQEAALYKLVNGNLEIGEVSTILPGKYLASDIELLLSGKHPGKTNLTDADNALNILRYFDSRPTAVIVKHNNPCGVARADTLEEAYTRAYTADQVAAFGGCIAVNQSLDKSCARAIASQYAEVVVAPEFEEGVVDILKKRKNLRVIRIGNIKALSEFAGERVVDFKSLIDGGIIAQLSFVPKTRTADDFTLAQSVHKGNTFRIEREPTASEYRDLLFGWLVETGITSNSVIYVKDEVTVGIGTGEQDRVGVAEIARDKAYRKRKDRYSFQEHGKPFHDLTDPDEIQAIEEKVKKEKGGLLQSAMVSDAFFPFKDGVEVGIREGISAVVQPGGSVNDHEVISACNQAGVAMVYTGQRCFKH